MSFRRNLEKMAQIYDGIAIFSVEKGSTTHRAGVRAGDILVAVNGRRVRKLAEYASARKLRSDLLELVVVRDGRELTLWGGHQASAERETARDGAEAMPEVEPLTCPWRGAT